MAGRSTADALLADEESRHYSVKILVCCKDCESGNFNSALCKIEVPHKSWVHTRFQRRPNAH